MEYQVIYRRFRRGSSVFFPKNPRDPKFETAGDADHAGGTCGATGGIDVFVSTQIPHQLACPPKSGPVLMGIV